MVDLIIDSSASHSLLLIVPIVCAGLLRWARCPGAAVVGGFVAGVLLGPTIFGRVLPDLYERLFEGGIQQRHVVEHLESEQGAEFIVAGQAALGDDEMIALRARHADELADARTRLNEARWAHQRPLRSYATVIIALTLISAPIVTTRRDSDSTDGVTGLAAPLSIGLWSAVVPAALTYAVLVWVWGLGATEATIAAAAVAIGPLGLTAGDRDAADRAEIGGAALMAAAAQIASMIAIIAVLVAALIERAAPGALAALPLLALPIGWMIAVRLRPSGDRPGQACRIVHIAIDVVLVPGIAACAALKIELFHHFSLWLVVAMVILSGDGRWLGAAGGALVLGGRRVLRTMRLVLGAMACGPPQLAVVAIAAHWWLVPPDVAMALVLGAVALAVLTPARQSVARRIMQIEEEME